MYKNKKIFIFGLARSGYEVAKLLSNYNNDIIVVDKTDTDIEHIQELNNLNIKFIKTDTPENLLDNSYNYVIKNPGIIKTHPCILKAKELGIRVINEIEVAYNFIKDKATIIGITGSNGKTTTTTMIYEIMKKANLNVHLAGNIGYPLSSIVNKVKKNDIIVAEISDHQLLDTNKFKTNISVLTNISPVHIDFHGTYENYKNTKKKIFNHHTSDDLAILNLNNKDVLDITKDIKSKKIYFSNNTKTDIYLDNNTIYYKNEPILNINDIKVKGIHNYENIMCMLGVVKEFNVSNNVIIEYLKEFKGVEHRIEFVRNINNITFYNDSKATNTESTIVALKSFNNNVILLLGGLDRGHSFEPLNPYLKNVKYILTFGETKDRIKEWSKKQNIKCLTFNNLKEATLESYKLAEENDTILLSPACASWDQYKCMEDRGNEFKNIVNNFK